MCLSTLVEVCYFEKVEVYIDATYEFLSDMLTSAGRQHCSRFKEIVFKRFTQFIKG